MTFNVCPHHCPAQLCSHGRIHQQNHECYYRGYIGGMQCACRPATNEELIIARMKGEIKGEL